VTMRSVTNSMGSVVKGMDKAMESMNLERVSYSSMGRNCLACGLQMRIAGEKCIATWRIRRMEKVGLDWDPEGAQLEGDCLDLGLWGVWSDHIWMDHAG
jgi:hypothetical protein